jgi:hypothetical protein
MKKIILILLFSVVTLAAFPQWTSIDTNDVLFGYSGGIWLVQPNDGWSFDKEFNHWDGNAWTTVLVDSAFYSSSCFFTNPNDGWVFSGSQDSIYRYHGLGWTKEYSGALPAGYWKYCDFFDSNNGWVVLSNSGDPYRYQNNNWAAAPVNFPPYMSYCYFNGISVGSANTAWMIGMTNYSNPAHDSAYIFRFTGSQWVIDTAIADFSFRDISFVDDNHGWAIGINNIYAGVVLKYNGNCWQSGQTIIDYDAYSHYGLQSIYMFNDHIGWAGGSSGKIYRYNGQTWSVQDSLPPPIIDFCFTDSINGWAFAYWNSHIIGQGLIYQTETGGFGFPDDKINNNSLNLFPNPSSDIIYIKSTKINSEKAQIQIYDIWGQLIWNKQNVRISAENNSIDISNFQNGIYLITVKSESGNFSSKFIKQ